LRSRGDGPGAALAVIEGHQLAHAQQIGLRKELVGPEPLRQLLAPRSRAPAEIAYVATAERRQPRLGNGLFSRQRFAQSPQRILGALFDGQPGTVARADIAVAAERTFEEEGVAFERPVRGAFTGSCGAVEEAEDAERRQQVAGKLNGSGRISKADSESRCSWRLP
jgi:hypothetical protein